MKELLPSLLLIAAILATGNWIHTLVDWVARPTSRSLPFTPMIVASIAWMCYIYPNSKSVTITLIFVVCGFIRIAGIRLLDKNH